MLKEEHNLAGTQLGAKTWNEFYVKHELERTMVLACGHLIGGDCYQMIEQDYADKTKPNALDPRSCFHCRADLRCAGCPLAALYDESFNPFIPGPKWPGNDPATSRWHPTYSFQELTLTTAETDRGARRYCSTCTIMRIVRKLVEFTLACPQCPTCASSPCSCTPEEQKKQQQQLPHLDREALAEEWLRRKIDQLGRLVYPSIADIRNPHLAARRGNEIADRRARFVRKMFADHLKFRELKQTIFRLPQLPQEAEKEGDDGTTAISDKLKTLFIRDSSPRAAIRRSRRPDWAHWAFGLAAECVEEFDRTDRMLRLPLAWFRGLEGDEEDDKDDASFRHLGPGKKRPLRWEWDHRPETAFFAMVMNVDLPGEGLAKVNPCLFAGTLTELVDVMWTHESTDGLKQEENTWDV
ncbi:hypothetical protein PG997_014338 [Apiospora hydei]|uniref:Uncharacterized protein n=1 Tax=Apiospora hydei TaxID=1337664 RepID=A0ABR1UVZ6_9PEZI